MIWKQLKAIGVTCLVFLSGIGGFIGGLIFYEKKIDKPETSIEIGKKSNITLPPTYSPPSTTAVREVEKPKRKFFNFLKRK